MTLTLHLPPDTEEALAEAAEQQGTTPEEAAEQALRELFTANPRPPSWAAPLTRPPYDPAKALATLDSFDDGDAEEQRETLNVLMEAIDRDRPGQRRIFGEGINPMPPLGETG